MLSYIPILAVILVLCVGLVLIIRSILSPQRTEEIARLTKNGNTPKAIRLAKKIISKNESNHLAHYYLGKAYIASGRYQQAMDEFNFLNMHDSFSDGLSEKNFRHDMAKLYLHFNQPEEALKEYLLLTKLDADNADVYYNCGLLLEKRGKHDQAYGFYVKCLNINKNHADAHLAIAKVKLHAKQYTDAEKEVNLAIKLAPKKFSYYYYLGKIKKETSSYPDAVKAFEKALLDAEYKQRAIVERGLCYMSTEQTDKALSDFDYAIKLSKADNDPTTLYARYFAAQIYERMHKLDAAIAHWKAIANVSQNFRDVNSKLSEYSDLQDNDFMKDYLTSSNTEFIEVCKTFALKAYAANVTDVSKEFGACSMRAVSASKEGFGNSRSQVMQFYFFRDSRPIEEKVVRDMVDIVKKNNFIKAVVCTSGLFTPTALSFASGRPVELLNKDKMIEMMEKAG